MKYSDYLKEVTACPFCASDKIRIVENDTAFLTYAVAPYHPDHILVIPKRHIERILDLTEKETRDIESLNRQALSILENLGYTNISILVKDGDKTEKSVAHTHYNIIPDVVLHDTDHTGADRIVLTEKEIPTAVARIRSAIRN